MLALTPSTLLLVAALLALGPDFLSAAPNPPPRLSIPITKRTPKFKSTAEIHASMRRKADILIAKYGAKVPESRKRASTASLELGDINIDFSYIGQICKSLWARLERLDVTSLVE